MRPRAAPKARRSGAASGTAAVCARDAGAATARAGRPAARATVAGYLRHRRRDADGRTASRGALRSPAYVDSHPQCEVSYLQHAAPGVIVTRSDHQPITQAVIIARRAQIAERCDFAEGTHILIYGLPTLLDSSVKVTPVQHRIPLASQVREHRCDDRVYVCLGRGQRQPKTHKPQPLVVQ